MACAAAASQAMLSANTCSLVSPRSFFKKCSNVKKQSNNNSFFRIRASSSADEADCNVEECAPDKEVGKVSMEWLAGEKTKVTGTFPPKKRGWTGYVEKDTAGQTNIYSIEPAVYVAESAISSGNSGSSADGAENTVAVAGGLALISIAAASLILLQVGKTPPPQVQTIDYTGPSLSYYINKFKPPEIIEASVPTQTESSPAVQPQSSAPEVSQPEIESGNLQELSTSIEVNVS